MAESRFERLVEDGILFYLIITKLFAFFGLLTLFEHIGIYPGEIDFIDIIVSMTGLAYVLYRASVSEIFFGKRKKYLDFALIGSYFLLIANKFVQFSLNSISESKLLTDFLVWIVDNAYFLESAAFYTGTIMLIIISLYVTIRIEIQGPSILDALHAEGQKKKIARFFTVFIVIVGFYLIFFNFVAEWMTRVLDAPLIVIAIFLYAFKIHNLGKSMNAEDILYKVSDVVENITEEFINLFHSKKTIFLGISGILVLHLISDVGAFVLPYAMNTGSLYQDEFGQSHNPLLALFENDKLALDDTFAKVAALFGYILNTVGMIFLMIFPSFIWYVIYVTHTREKQESIVFPKLPIAIFYSSLLIMLFLPVYRISSISPGLSYAKNILGVDIQTQSLLASGNNVLVFIGLGLLAFFTVLLLSNIALVKEILFFVMTLICVSFFGLYIYYFFSSLFWFYLDLIKVLAGNLSLYLLFYNLVFLVITVTFYVGGYVSFVVSVFKSEEHSPELPDKRV